MLGNRNFNTYFESNLIKNCNIKLFNNFVNPDLLIDKEHIKSFTMVRNNEGALSNAPSDSVVIDVLNWDTIPNDEDIYQRDTLSTPTTTSNGNYIWVSFFVNGDETDKMICLAIEKCEIDDVTNTAKITLYSPFRTMVDIGSMYNYKNEGFDTFPVNVTGFEKAQVIALNKGRGLIIPSGTGEYTPNSYSLADINDNNAVIGLDVKNITGKISKYKETNDKSNIHFYGIATGVETTIYTEEKYPTYIFQYTLSYTFEFNKKQYVINDFHVYQGGTDVTDRFEMTVFNDYLIVNSKSGASLSNVPYELQVLGYEAELVSPSDYNYVKSYAWLNSNNNERITAELRLQDFYENDLFYEFDCRLDPRIEPLDNVYVEGIGVIKVTNLSMKFKGGFTGHIKGRKVGDTSSIQPVTISGLTYTINTFSFTINNPNSVKVIARIVDDYGNNYDVEVNANGSLLVTNSSVSSGLMQAFRRCYMGLAKDDIYIITRNYNVPVIEASSTTLVVRGFVAPYLSDWDTGDNYYFVIENQNDRQVEMTVIYSSAKHLTFTLEANETITLDENNASELYNSVSAYDDGDLTADVYAYFTDDIGNSVNSIILEANA